MSAYALIRPMRAARLLVSLSVFGAILYFGLASQRDSLKGATTASSVVPSRARASAASSGARRTPGASPAADDPASRIRREVCVAGCAGDDRTCRTLALDEQAIDACKRTMSTCESRCP